MAFVEFHNVKKTYHTGEISIDALRDVNFQVEKGEFCVVVGASGARKNDHPQYSGRHGQLK